MSAVIGSRWTPEHIERRDTATGFRLTAEVLRGVLRYEPEDGQFYRLADGCGRQNRKGAVAGYVQPRSGYRLIRVAGTGQFVAHRLVWLYMTGGWPADEIDHINGDRSDNRFVNLRAASKTQNMQNKRVYRNNALGIAGVWQAGNKFRASIQHLGVVTKLGRFETAEEASAAYVKAKRELHEYSTL